MNFTQVCWNIAHYTGRAAGKTRNHVLEAKTKLEYSAKTLSPQNFPSRIRDAMLKKLLRQLYKQVQLVMGQLSERIEIIDEVAVPFYDRIRQMAANGPVTEARLWETLNSISASRKLTDPEKTLLVAVFGQIAGINTPQTVEATIIKEEPVSNSPNNALGQPARREDGK